MKISLRRLIPLAASVGMALVAGAAQADEFSSFTLRNGTAGPGGIISEGIQALDWNEQGSGVAKGIGPFGTPLVLGKEFNFYYQANLKGMTGGTETTAWDGLDNSSNGTPKSGSTFEITIVAKMREVVQSFIPTSLTSAKATFGLAGTAADNKVALFYDTKNNAKTSDGTGFDDGVMIALLTIVSDGTSSDFTQENPNKGKGAARIKAVIAEAGDFINPLYLEGVSKLLFGIDFQSDLNYPSDTSFTTGFHGSTPDTGPDLFGPVGVIQSEDILFKVDGSSRFTVVPEPGSIFLLGIGLLGAACAQRRRRQS
jgi:hypothetical protein